ncbi:MAG: DUF1566 domain-containing protein [Saprospirales bacterium]|nr:DUF1566 domain-containing protein [Saprospirales bacterium]
MRKISMTLGLLACICTTAFSQPFKIVDTNQSDCYHNEGPIPAPAPGNAFYGQDAQHNGYQPAYQDNGDGTITDLVTGLMWQQNLYPGKYTYPQAVAGADTCTVGGYDDWRLPTIKELYSLILFSGKTGMNTQTSIPFLDTNYFDFRYGFEDIGERFIDAQYASSTAYVGTTMMGFFTIFGVNFADGRIKGYGTNTPMGEKTFEVRYVRGVSNYGINDFVDNMDGTVTDAATGLMWIKNDNGEGLNWEGALAWVQEKNAENYLGYDDWRLPNAKELQSIVDYSRSLQTTNSAALDPVFESSTITDEGEMTNYPFGWTSTTHGDGPPDMAYTKAVYVCFGEALGFMEMPPMSGNYNLLDVHGAGAQRSDPKTGDPADFPLGNGPQGDVIRIFNYVRLVRDVNGTTGMIELEGKENRVEVYPNPARDLLHIVLDSNFWENGDFALYDSAGKSVIAGKVSGNNLNLDIRSLPAGVYFLQMEKEGVRVTRKVIID